MKLGLLAISIASSHLHFGLPSCFFPSVKTIVPDWTQQLGVYGEPGGMKQPILCSILINHTLQISSTFLSAMLHPETSELFDTTRFQYIQDFGSYIHRCEKLKYRVRQGNQTFLSWHYFGRCWCGKWWLSKTRNTGTRNTVIEEFSKLAVLHKKRLTLLRIMTNK
jgi:hypothetical protein